MCFGVSPKSARDYFRPEEPSSDPRARVVGSTMSTSEASDLRDLVAISSGPLSLDKAYRHVNSPSAGAVVTFVGTTRDVFQGKKVDRLEYECYEPMALRKLRELCVLIRGKWDVTAIYIAHRTGTVNVKESSVTIAISSAHRVAALEATHWTIDELKATVPIWKKEFFEGGEVWKENEEQRREVRKPP